jgi:TPR repeat protein
MNIYKNPESRSISILILLFFPFFSIANDLCSLKEVGLTEKSALAERLFYVGTCHYRHQKYEQSVPLWKDLTELQNIEPEYVELQINALNNLGFMFFFGYGIEENKDLAINYWNKAIALGHTESEYHLCHAYADPKVSTYNAVKALPHCKKAKLLYRGMGNKNNQEKDILKQINKYLRQLEN